MASSYDYHLEHLVDDINFYSAKIAREVADEMTAKELYALLDAHGIRYELVEIFECARILNIEVEETGEDE